MEVSEAKRLRACRAAGTFTVSYCRKSRSRLENRHIRKEVLELSGKHPRHGYRRITALMRRNGFELNAKRVAHSVRGRNQSEQENNGA
jgi:putative transposase